MIAPLCALLILLALPSLAAEEAAVRIAFLDSGISLKHLDAAQVEAGENFVFPEEDTDDRIGHGTATAGIVLGSEELGLAGVCPQATVVPLVCYDSYPSGVRASGGAETLAAAIYAAVDRYDCRILNISMGTTEDSAQLRAAVEYALAQGAVIVSAVGNSNRSAPQSVYYPAAYDGVIGVGAADGERAADFSQRHGVDVLAQGVSLETVTHRNAAEVSLRSGTSYACAYVSGLCAALLRDDPSLRAEKVCRSLFASAKDLGEPGYDADSGWGLVAAQSEEPSAVGFADVSAEDDCAEAVAWAVESGITNGTDASHFRPNASCTRAQIVTFLWRAAGSPEAQSASGFSDVQPESYYAEAVAWAVGSGIAAGTGAAAFSPDASCTRAQAVTFLYRAAGSPAVSGGAAFDDVSADAYYAAAVAWAQSGSITEGVGGGCFAPDAACTRGQIVTLLWRAHASSS